MSIWNDMLARGKNRLTKDLLPFLSYKSHPTVSPPTLHATDSPPCIPPSSMDHKDLILLPYFPKLILYVST